MSEDRVLLIIAQALDGWERVVRSGYQIPLCCEVKDEKVRERYQTDVLFNYAVNVVVGMLSGVNGIVEREE